MQHNNSIQNARSAIQSLNLFLGEVEGSAAAYGKRRAIVGFDHIIWDKRVIMEVFGISGKTVDRHRRDGKFPAFRIGKTYYFYREHILDLIPGYLKKSLPIPSP